ncbi:protein of unknown function [Kyrpidia spormannii]|uniref:Uncharacterized protein n=2 Tax=Kyrpidia spormannii TaxID=2055160 RepID=A0ACA8Z5M7_9BACL|nr:protein of unknown function [Kyrpidia spormannii]CAB3390683.1 protein of unknown function [Kyrpidia spormannii]
MGAGFQENARLRKNLSTGLGRPVGRGICPRQRPFAVAAPWRASASQEPTTRAFRFDPPAGAMRRWFLATMWKGDSSGDDSKYNAGKVDGSDGRLLFSARTTADAKPT